MILEAAVALSTFGLAGFIIGSIFDYTGVAIIGAAMVLLVGAMITANGLEVKTGADETTSTHTEIVAAESIEQAEQVGTLDVSTEDNTPTAVTFREDGTAMYISGQQNDAIQQYSTTDFDVTLATHERSFDVSAQTTDPGGVTFGDAGSRMYVSGVTGDTIYEYGLSEAWNVSTASFTRSLSVASETSSPRATALDATGTIMYVVGAGPGEIVEYSLSEAWNVSSASVADQFDVSGQEDTPAGLAFDDDGERMVLVGESQDTVFEYELSTGFDISSASYNGESLSVGSWASRPSGVDFEASETRLFVSGRQSAEVHQFDVTVEETVDETTVTHRYEPVETPARFPLGLLTMLFAAALMMQKLRSEGGL